MKLLEEKFNISLFTRHNKNNIWTCIILKIIIFKNIFKVIISKNKMFLIPKTKFVNLAIILSSFTKKYYL